MPYSIYAGPVDRKPIVISDKTAGASGLLPGTWVTEGATSVTQATAIGPMVRLLDQRDYYSQGQFDANDPLKTAYASGDTGIAYVLEPGQRYLVAVAAATYTFGQELTVAASVRLAAATTGNIVFAHFDQAGGTLAAGDLADVCIANSYTKA